jgi:hypothetical protein
MTYKLPSLTVRRVPEPVAKTGRVWRPVLLVVCLLLALVLGTLAKADDEVAPDGNALVAAAVTSLIQQPTVEAKIRQRASILGQLVAGAGLYVQTRKDDQLLVRFEFKLQVGDQSLSVLQVNDGSTLWIRRDVDNLQTQAHVNLRRLREAANQQAASAPPRFDANQLAVGGLAQLLESLTERFQFGPAMATEVAGIPMWELTGEWKTEQLLQLLPSQGNSQAGNRPTNLDDLPPHLPTTVKLTLGRDRNFPLFPYRIEYGRLHAIPSDSGKSASPPVVLPLVTMELFEVRRRTDLTPDLFAFPVGDQNVEDQTDLYLKRMGTNVERP